MEIVKLDYRNSGSPFFPNENKTGKGIKRRIKKSIFFNHLHMDSSDQSVKKTLLDFYNRKVDPTFNYRLFPNFLLSYTIPGEDVIHCVLFIRSQRIKETTRKELYLSKQGLCFSSLNQFYHQSENLLIPLARYKTRFHLFYQQLKSSGENKKWARQKKVIF